MEWEFNMEKLSPIYAFIQKKDFRGKNSVSIILLYSPSTTLSIGVLWIGWQAPIKSFVHR